MSRQNPNPSPGQLAAWRQLWAILLAPQRRDEDAAPADQAGATQAEDRDEHVAPPR